MGSKLKLCEVTYFNAEHTKHKVTNLLTGNGKWASPVRFKEDLVCEFSLQGPARLTRIDVGNYWSASVEISVGLSSWPSSKRELFASHNFMNRITSLSGDNKEQVLTFTGAHFKEVSETYWDRIRITCKQPYRCENDCFGLSIVDVSGFLKNSSESSQQAADTITPKINEKDINTFIQQKFNIMKNTPKTSPSRLLSTLQGGFKHPDLSKTLTPQNRKDNNVEQITPSNRVRVSLTPQGGFNKDSEPQKNKTPQNRKDVNVEQQTHTNQAGASRDRFKERTDVTKNTIKEEENLELLETFTPDQFHKKCVRFLENSLKDYGIEELRLVSYNIIKRLWSAKYGKEVIKSQKKILKQASEEYLVERVEALENEEIINIQIDETATRTGKRKLSSVGSDEHEEKENKRMDRNAVIDFRDESNQDDENINNNSRASNSSKKSNLTPSRLARRRTSSSKRQRVKSGSGGKPKPDMKAVPNADGWFSSTNPRNSQEAMKTLPLKFTQAVMGYNPSNLLQIPRSELEQAGILFQQYNYQKEKGLPIKDQENRLVVERLEPVKFFKCGPDIFLVYKNRFYDPDVDEAHLERLFKNHSPSKVKNNRPISKEIRDFINNYGVTAEPAEVVTVVDDDETVVDNEHVVNDDIIVDDNIAEENTNQAEERLGDDVRGNGASGTERNDTGVECPLCMKSFSPDLIQDHAETCDGVDLEDNGDVDAPMNTCPLCNKSMDPSILQDHAATCTGDSRPSSAASSRPNSPALAASSQGASSSTTTKPTFTFVTSSSVTNSRSSQVISVEDDDETVVTRPLKYGDCPVCKRRMKMEELPEHAMGCQGFELNGGNGLHVNVMDSQGRCDFCNQLIPEIVMQEHVEECPARGVRQRVLTAVEKRINRNKNNWR